MHPPRVATHTTHKHGSRTSTSNQSVRVSPRVCSVAGSEEFWDADERSAERVEGSEHKVSDFQLDLLLRLAWVLAFMRGPVKARRSVCLGLHCYIEFWALILAARARYLTSVHVFTRRCGILNRINRRIHPFNLLLFTRAVVRINIRAHRAMCLFVMVVYIDCFFFFLPAWLLENRGFLRICRKFNSLPSTRTASVINIRTPCLFVCFSVVLFCGIVSLDKLLFDVLKQSLVYRGFLRVYGKFRATKIHRTRNWKKKREKTYKIFKITR